MHRFFFHLLILLLPVQLGYHFWPEWSMVLGRRVDYLSPTLFFTDILIILILIFWLRKLPVQLMLLFSLFAGVNIFFSLNRAVALYHWIKVVEFGLLGYYIVKTKPSLSVISNLLSVSIVYSSIIAIFQFLFQHSLGGLFWLLGERTFALDTPGIARIAIGGKELLRAYGTFPHPNVLGGFLAITVPFIIIQLSNKIKYFFFISLTLGVVALMLTFSRSAWVVFALGIGYWVWSKKKNKFWIPAFAGMTIILLFFVPLSWTDESVVVRNELNASAIAMVKSAPFFGVGLGNFLVALPQFLPSRTIYFLQPVHNIYLLLFSEIGIIGVIGGIWVIRGRMKLSVPLVALLLLGFVDHYPFTLQQGRLLLTLFIALSYRGHR